MPASGSVAGFATAISATTGTGAGPATTHAEVEAAMAEIGRGRGLLAEGEIRAGLQGLEKKLIDKMALPDLLKDPKLAARLTPSMALTEQLLRSKGVTEINFIRVDVEPQLREEMMTRTGRRTVPQIYIGATHVGGFDDLAALDRAGGLDPLLAS